MKTLFATIIMLVAATASAEDMQKYLSDTQRLVQLGKHEEALERFIWFHEHALEHDPAMTGVRLSFALSYWKSLAGVYPPARTALAETRDVTTRSIVEGAGDFATFQEVVALNRTLGEDNRTVELFQALDQDKPDLARGFWPLAKDALVKAKCFDLVRKYLGDPEEAFARVKKSYDENMRLAKDRGIGGPEFKSWNEAHFVDESLQLIEIELALDDPKTAAAIQKNALTVVDSPRLRKAIPAPK